MADVLTTAVSFATEVTVTHDSVSVLGTLQWAERKSQSSIG